jgi:methionyl aminopeptidase
MARFYTAVSTPDRDAIRGTTPERVITEVGFRSESTGEGQCPPLVDSPEAFIAGWSRSDARLCQITYEALWRGIKAVRPGATLGDLGHAIQTYVESERCSVVRDYCGHGIGRVFHDAPSVLHYGEPGQGLVFEPGMLFTIEPMVNLGTHEVKLKRDGWTVVTKDLKPSAQFEHTVGVTEDGVEVFTLSPADQPHPAW